MGREDRGEVVAGFNEARSTDGSALAVTSLHDCRGYRARQREAWHKYPPLHCSNKVGLLLYITNTKHHVIDIMHTSLHWFDEQFKTADLTFAVNYNLTQQMR